MNDHKVCYDCSAVSVDESVSDQADLERGDISEEIHIRTKLGPNDEGYGSFSSMEADQHHKTTGHLLEVPQGRHLGIYSTTVLFVSRILGSGIFTIPSSMFVNCGGNVLLFFGIWVLSAALAFAGLYLFLEFGSWIPKSGGRKNFLEQTYTKPNLMMSVTFASYSVMSGLTLSNAIVFGKYVLYSLGYDDVAGAVQQQWSKVISIVVILSAVLIHGFSVRRGIFIQNIFGGMKLVLIILMCGTGIYTLFFYHPDLVQGQMSLPKDDLHFLTFQEDAVVSISSIAAAIISSFFCFAGWDSVHSVVSEVKNPSRTLKISGPVSLFVCFICYLLVNLAYVNVLTFEEIKEAGPLIGSVLFTKILGPSLGSKVLSMTVALSAFSNILVVMYGISRMNQEVFREGYLPFSEFMASNTPGDAPLPAILICAVLTIAWIVVLPGDSASFDYLINMEGYGTQFFLFLIAIGLFIFRRKHTDDEKRPEIRASSVGVVVLAMLSFYLLLAPFIDRKEQVVKIESFPAYQNTTLLIIFGCFLYWFIGFFALPRLCGYKLKSKIILLNDGLITTKWVKRYY